MNTLARARRPRMARLFVPAGGAAAVAFAASAFYQAMADARDRRRFPPPGRLVDIGDSRLHVMDAGDGSPAVVIVPALADNVLGWLPVWRAAAEFSRACVYDRSGIGWSAPPHTSRCSFDDLASELHRMLAAAGIPPPYLLVGHSVGGIISRRFAARYPQEVAGMVLVDSSHEDQEKRLGYGRHIRLRYLMIKQWARPPGLYRLAAAAGFARGLDASVARQAPSEHQTAARALSLSSRQHRADLRELRIFIGSQGGPPDLGSLPLTVITAADRESPWVQLQSELAATSTNSEHVTADKAGHFVHRDEPELVIQSIRKLLARSRE